MSNSTYTSDIVAEAMNQLGYPADFPLSVAESAVHAHMNRHMLNEDELEAFAAEMDRTGFHAGERPFGYIEELTDKVADLLKQQ